VGIGREENSGGRRGRRRRGAFVASRRDVPLSRSGHHRLIRPHGGGLLLRRQCQWEEEHEYQRELLHSLLLIESGKCTIYFCSCFLAIAFANPGKTLQGWFGRALLPLVGDVPEPQWPVVPRPESPR